jgi:hypothetical protein
MRLLLVPVGRSALTTVTFVLAHALYLKAIHGGKAKNDPVDASKLVMLLRGGKIPVAYVYPPDMTSRWRRSPISPDELDLCGCAVRISMHYRPDIAGFESVLGHTRVKTTNSNSFIPPSVGREQDRP